MSVLFLFFWAMVCFLGFFALVATLYGLFVHDVRLWPMSLSLRMLVWWGIWASVGFYYHIPIVGWLYLAVGVLELLYFIFGFTIVEISKKYLALGGYRDKENHLLYVYPLPFVRVTVPLREGAL